MSAQELSETRRRVRRRRRLFTLVAVLPVLATLIVSDPAARTRRGVRRAELLAASERARADRPGRLELSTPTAREDSQGGDPPGRIRPASRSPDAPRQAGRGRLEPPGRRDAGRSRALVRDPGPRSLCGGTRGPRRDRRGGGRRPAGDPAVSPLALHVEGCGPPGALLLRDHGGRRHTDLRASLRMAHAGVPARADRSPGHARPPELRLSARTQGRSETHPTWRRCPTSQPRSWRRRAGSHWTAIRCSGRPSCISCSS